MIEKKISEIIPYEKNAKIHSEKQIRQVADSIKRFGFLQPVVISKDNVVVIGHCRLEAAKLLGMEKIPVISVENLTDEEVKALRLADNKLNESDWDMELVAGDLLLLDEDLRELTGFNEDDLRIDLTGANKEVDIDLLNAENNAECPKCKFRFRV